jgi:hypothetical protein
MIFLFHKKIKYMDEHIFEFANYSEVFDFFFFLSTMYIHRYSKHNTNVCIILCIIYSTLFF